MSIKLLQIGGMKFMSGGIASTDIHNAGSIFGIIYRQILTFGSNNTVTLINKIEINRASFLEWSENIEKEKWTGKYKLDIDHKHVKCSLTNERTKATKQIFADFATSELLICEVYDNESNHGKGQVFEKINSKWPSVSTVLHQLFRRSSF